MAQQENKLQDMIRTSLESIRSMVDANTVVGTPIDTASGTTIIPISKISVGYASGGADTKKDPAARTLFAGGCANTSSRSFCERKFCRRIRGRYVI